MITKENLQEAIAECQGKRNPTSDTCLKLAAYYIVQDQTYNKPQSKKSSLSYSYAKKPQIPSTEGVSDGDSEFLDIVKGKDINDVLLIIDELMNTLNIINPRLYEGVITKLLY